MSERGTPKRLWQRIIWPILLTLPVLVVAVLTAGVFAPIPFVDVVASMLSAQFAWVFLAALLITLASFALWRASRTRYRTVLLALSGGALLGWIIVSAHSLTIAPRENMALDAGQLFFGHSLENGAPDLTLEYTQYNGRPLTISVWRPARADGAAPVLVMTHGGGFVGGSVEEQMLPNARFFANNGYLVIGANYTLSSTEVHAWDVTEGQIACALAWANAHASEYGGDISRLGMYGESAGGNLVINTSYKIASGALVSSCGGELPHVGAVSAIYPVVGIIEAYENPHQFGKLGRQFDEQYLGGTPEQFPERYASAQSANAISAEAPPTFIVYGGSDHLVPPNGTENFVTAATGAGVEIRAISIPYSEHGFDLYNTGGVGAQLWRQGTLLWFETHLSAGQPPS